MRLILESAGGSLEDLVTMSVFVTDFAWVTSSCDCAAKFLKRDFPASALIGISQLAAPDALIEIQATAALQ
jgi:enamine deaminase RidA (YjgF/YER057c/UK114 family)